MGIYICNNCGSEVVYGQLHVCNTSTIPKSEKTFVNWITEYGQWVEKSRYEAMKTRAESAEAEVKRLREKLAEIEKLGREWKSSMSTEPFSAEVSDIANMGFALGQIIGIADANKK